MKEKTKNRFKKLLSCILNPRFLLCFGIAWMITNGWAYILLGIGTYLQIKWMMTVGSLYLAFLWMPFTPEKIVTIPIAIALLKLFFPKDEKTLAFLTEMLAKTKKAIRQKKKKEDGSSESSEENADEPDA